MLGVLERNNNICVNCRFGLVNFTQSPVLLGKLLYILKVQEKITKKAHKEKKEKKSFCMYTFLSFQSEFY